MTEAKQTLIHESENPLHEFVRQSVEDGWLRNELGLRIADGKGRMTVGSRRARWLRL
jgi:hypothetical protein